MKSLSQWGGLDIETVVVKLRSEMRCIYIIGKISFIIHHSSSALEVTGVNVPYPFD